MSWSRGPERRSSTYPDLLTTWEESKQTQEFRVTRQVYAAASTTVRIDCFCCSCDTSETLISVDPYCRKHGIQTTRRECDIHDMPGILTVSFYARRTVTEQRRTYGDGISQ